MEYTINIKGRLMDLSTPQVMGILNVTPDSFYSGSRKQTEMEIAQRANQIIEEGGCLPPYNSQIRQRHISERQYQGCYRRAYSNPLPSLH